MADIRGIVFEIREFCLHDGPGLRTTVFLKGCPLRCLWCHNPEGQDPRPQMMRTTATPCLQCGACRRICKHPEGCVACGACVPHCPAKRLHIFGTAMTAADVAAAVMRDRRLFAESGGGITFSGGEPLMQIDFLCEVARLVAPVHVAVETSGFASPETYSRMLDATQLVLQDWKCASDELHRRFTGATNASIKENIRMLAQSGRAFILRLPLVPGLNDGDSELDAAAQFFADIRTDGLQEVQLLPYHAGADAKYRQLGIPHMPLELPADAINPRAVGIFTAHGLPCSLL